jgi:xanthine dehydrogenase YagS FAD-binding subunit
MKNINHVNVTNLDAAVDELGKGKAAIIAGGTDILYDLKIMNSPNLPDTLVNIKTIPNLSYIREEDDLLKIGALTHLAEIAGNTTIQSKYTALAQAARQVATPELRNMGTIAGNLCQHVRCWYYRMDHDYFPCLRKNPKGICYAVAGDHRFHSIFGGVQGCFAVNPGDTAPALIALNASIVTTKKTVRAENFFAVKLSPNEGSTVLDDDEIVKEIQVPVPAAGIKSAFMKFAQRKAFDFAIVNCAAATGAGDARICLNAVYNLPKRVTAAEDLVKGKTIDETLARSAGDAAVNGAIPLPPIGFGPGNGYMVQIARTLVARTLLQTKA